MELEKKNRIKRELESKFEEEQNRIQIALERKNILENEEEEIIKKIQTTTQIHNQMIENLSKLTSSKKK